MLAAGAVVGATLLSLVLMVTATLPPPGYAVDPTTGVPVGDIFPAQLRLLTPFMNITGAFALILGAVFSTYVFMPKRRVLPYSLDPNQPGDQFLFNLLIAPFAIAVNLIASLPGPRRALFTGRIHSRVPATILIAIGAFIPAITDSLNRFGVHRALPARASSLACSSCSSVSSSRSRSSARSGSRSPGSALPPGGASPRRASSAPAEEVPGLPVTATPDASPKASAHR